MMGSHSVVPHAPVDFGPQAWPILTEVRGKPPAASHSRAEGQSRVDCLAVWLTPSSACKISETVRFGGDVKIGVLDRGCLVRKEDRQDGENEV